MSHAGPRPAQEAPAGVGGPHHVALIMDGNGRWAAARGMPRTFGHRAGVKALKATVEAAPDFGIRCLTVFGFSTENWRRPAAEVGELMGLVRAYVESDLERMTREGVRLKVLGRRDNLPADIAALVERAEARTASNDRFLMQVAFNYGARDDIVAAARRLIASGLSPEAVTDAAFEAALSTSGAPPVDMIVRTSGERRLSNFLLWEAAYAELVFQDVLWPDYGPQALGEAVEEFRRRSRRYGGLDASTSAAV